MASWPTRLITIVLLVAPAWRAAHATEDQPPAWLVRCTAQLEHARPGFCGSRRWSFSAESPPWSPRPELIWFASKAFSPPIASTAPGIVPGTPSSTEHVPNGGPQEPSPPASPTPQGKTLPARAGHRLDWATLLRRTFAIDVLACERCGGRRQLCALITEEKTAHKILAHLGLPKKAPAESPSRAPQYCLWAALQPWASTCYSPRCSRPGL